MPHPLKLSLNEALMPDSGGINSRIQYGIGVTFSDVTLTPDFDGP